MLFRERHHFFLLVRGYVAYNTIKTVVHQYCYKLLFNLTQMQGHAHCLLQWIYSLSFRWLWWFKSWLFHYFSPRILRFFIVIHNTQWNSWRNLWLLRFTWSNETYLGKLKGIKEFILSIHIQEKVQCLSPNGSSKKFL